jgi:hypothetical protein
MAFNLYVAPGKMRDTWGIRFSLAHVFNRKEFSAFRIRNAMLPNALKKAMFLHVSILMRRIRGANATGWPLRA